MRARQAPQVDTYAPAQGSPRTPGTPGTRGRHRPPVGRRVRAISRPTGRGRATGGATIWPMVVGGGRNVRALRSSRVQQKLQQAHEAVVNAMMDEDEGAEVVKPTYLVQKVMPNNFWPDGGVVIYAQFPFLLDQWWRRSGSWAAFCPKAVCAPDCQSQGVTYGVFFTLQREEGGDSGGSAAVGGMAAAATVNGAAGGRPEASTASVAVGGGLPRAASEAEGWRATMAVTSAVVAVAPVLGMTWPLMR